MPRGNAMPKRLTKADKEAIEEWHDNKWWPWYRGLKKLHPGSGHYGNKTPSRNAMVKMARKDSLSIKDLDAILATCIEIARYDMAKKAKGEHVPWWPYSETFINQRRFEREIGSFQDLYQAKAVKICKCGEKAEHFNGDLATCHKCFVLQYTETVGPSKGKKECQKKSAPTNWRQNLKV